MLSGPGHHPRFAAVSQPSVRDCLLRRQARRQRPQHHRHPSRLRALDRGLLHVLDFLRLRGSAPRRAASDSCRSISARRSPSCSGWVVIRKIIRISKVNRITSIADFIASRYGKSFALGSVVSIIAVVGILPYISLQLKAISTSFSILSPVSGNRDAEGTSAHLSCRTPNST